MIHAPLSHQKWSHGVKGRRDGVKDRGDAVASCTPNESQSSVHYLPLRSIVFVLHTCNCSSGDLFMRWVRGKCGPCSLCPTSCWLKFTCLWWCCEEMQRRAYFVGPQAERRREQRTKHQTSRRDQTEESDLVRVDRKPKTSPANRCSLCGPQPLPPGPFPTHGPWVTFRPHVGIRKHCPPVTTLVQWTLFLFLHLPRSLARDSSRSSPSHSASGHFQEHFSWPRSPQVVSGITHKAKCVAGGNGSLACEAVIFTPLFPLLTDTRSHSGHLYKVNSAEEKQQMSSQLLFLSQSESQFSFSLASIQLLPGNSCCCS